MDDEYTNLAQLTAAALLGCTVALVLTDRRGRIQYINKAAENLLGLGANDLSGTAWSDHIHVTDNQHALARSLDTLATQSSLEAIMGGQCVDVSITPVHDDDDLLGYSLTLSLRDNNAAESKRQFEVALDSGQIGFWTWDVASDRFDQKGYWTNQTALGGHDSPITGARLLELTHPGDRDRVRASLTAYLKGETDHYKVEQRVMTNDGTYRCFLARGEASQRNANGEVLEVIGTHTDITQVREQEAILQLALESSAQAVWQWDLGSGVITEHGFRSQDLEEYSLTSPISVADFGALIHPDDVEGARIATLTHLRDRSNALEMEIRIRREDGIYGEFLIRGRARNLDGEGRYQQMIGTCTDITARKAADRKLRIALENGLQGLWEWEPVNDLTSFSPEWYQMFGYPEGSMRSHLVDTNRILHPDDLEQGRCAIVPALRGESDEFEVEHRMRHADGHYLSILSRGRVAERDAAGNATSVLGSHVDITKLKSMQAELSESQSFMRSVVDSMPQRIFWKDKHSNYLGCSNDFACDIGLKNPDEVIGLTDNDMPWSDIAQQVRYDDQLILSGENEGNRRERYLTLVGGRQMWVETCKAPIYAQDGSVVGVLGTYYDITSRYAREQQLKVIADALTGDSHRRLLSQLTSAAVELTGATYAYIGRLDSGPEHARVAEITACFPEDAEFASMSYEIAGTPCELLPDCGTQLIKSGAHRAVRPDAFISRTGVEGYAGRTLIDGNGNPIGLFILLFQNGIEDSVQVTTVMDVFSGRASAELEREITHAELRESEHRMRVIADAFTAIRGRRLLDSLAGAAGKLAEADYAFVARIDPDGYAEVITNGGGDSDLAGTQYDLQGTPCELATTSDRCSITESVQSQFPNDQVLVDWQIDAYVARRLLDGSGNTIGLFILLFKRPLENLSEVDTVIDIFAGRAAAELEREVTHSILKTNEERLNAAIDSGEHGVWEWDVDNDRLQFFGNRFTKMQRFSDSGQPGSSISKQLLPDDMVAMQAAMVAHLKGTTSYFEFEGRFLDDENTWCWILVHGRVIERNGAGRALRVVGTMTDITAQKSAQNALERSQNFLELIIDTVPQAIFWQNRDFRYLGCNDRFANLAGVTSPEVLLGRNVQELWWGDNFSSFITEDQALLDGEKFSIRNEQELIDPSGRRSWVQIIKVPMLDEDNQIIGVLGSIQDISERKEAEQAAQRLSLYDPLTNLPNRRYFTERLESSLAASTRRGSKGALLFIDLDQFKQINDTLGHSVGDSLLKAVAERLQNVTRQEDMVARLGGDEFVVLLPDAAPDMDLCAQHARRVADKIHESLGKPFQFDRHQFHVTPTIGVSLFPEGNKGMEEVLREADTAMYSGKAAGRNVTRFFQREMEERAQQQLRIEVALRHAIERDELELYYQPQVDHLGNVMGAEVLLRWHHPEMGQISPVEFIPVAEERGLIIGLGWWVLETAFCAMKSWIDNNTLDIGELAINLSSRQFRAENFVEDVEKLLIKYRIPPHRIVFELTEGTVVEDVELTIAVMERLRRVGIRFSIDDFGTGYSSLAYLKRLPIDQLKIDRSFTSDIGQDLDDEVICQTIIAMSQQLRLQTIAEGVETQEQLDFLSRLRCNAYQGYLFSAPCPESEFITYCQQNAT